MMTRDELWLWTFKCAFLAGSSVDVVAAVRTSVTAADVARDNYPADQTASADDVELLWRALALLGVEIDRSVVESWSGRDRSAAEQWVTRTMSAAMVGGEPPELPEVLREPEWSDEEIEVQRCSRSR